MPIPSRQIGWGVQENLLWEVAKQLEKLGCQLCNVGIPGPPGPSGGIFVQTANSTPITGTTAETTIINGGLGSLSIPANGFSVGDSFRAEFGGVMDASNNETIRIKVKAGSLILLDSGVQTLTSSIINDVWSLYIDFTIRQIGTAGVASIMSIGRFTYAKTNNGNVEGFAFQTLNNTTFDTTISNTLDVTVQWGSNDPVNNIYSDFFVLSKIY